MTKNSNERHLTVRTCGKNSYHENITHRCSPLLIVFVAFCNVRHLHITLTAVKSHTLVPRFLSASILRCERYEIERRQSRMYRSLSRCTIFASHVAAAQSFQRCIKSHQTGRKNTSNSLNNKITFRGSRPRHQSRQQSQSKMVRLLPSNRCHSPKTRNDRYVGLLRC